MLKLINARNMEFINVLNYLNEFKKNSDDLNSYAISCAILGPESYFSYVYSFEENMYYLVDDYNLNYIIGYGSINFNFDNTGNIAYGIRPSERNRGYGTALLSLILNKCEKIGMSEVFISCYKDNYYSKKIILNNNGKLDKEFYDEVNNKECLKFCVKLNPSILKKIKKKFY